MVSDPGAAGAFGAARRVTSADGAGVPAHEGAGAREKSSLPRGRASAGRAPRRVNEPQPALVESGFDGTPALVNRQSIAVVREEWRVVDRWWTEEPVSRRYFDVVLESGQQVVVFNDEERGSWFSQRGA